MWLSSLKPPQSPLPRSLFCASRGHRPLLSNGTYLPQSSLTHSQCPHIDSHFLKTRDGISSSPIFELMMVPNTAHDIWMFVSLTYTGILVYWTLLEANVLLVNILKSCRSTEDLQRGFLFCIIAAGKKELIICYLLSTYLLCTRVSLHNICHVTFTPSPWGRSRCGK